MKTAIQISDEVMDANYGADSDWAKPNEHGESGFTLAQVETDIGKDEITCLIQQGIKKDRAQLCRALEGSGAVPGFREHPLATVDALIDAYENFDGDVDDFVTAWNDYTAGKDFPCPKSVDGMHEVADGACTRCGDNDRG